MKKTRTLSLLMLLGLGAGFWFTHVIIAPQIAQANTARVELSIESLPNESYETMVSRAAAAIRRIVQQNFDQDNQVTDVSIIVLADNQGAIAPVLSLRVNRADWSNIPDAQRWTTYLDNAKALLGFENVATTTLQQPGATTNSTPQQPTNNTPSQPGNTNIVAPAEESTINTPGLPSTTTPTTSNQNPTPGTGLVPQPPVVAPVNPLGNPQSPNLQNNANPYSPTPQNNVSPNLPASVTPTNAPQNPLAPLPTTNGTTTNNPVPTN